MSNAMNRNRKLLWMLLGLIPVVAGCRCGPGGRSLHELTFTWSFYGQTCAAVPDVARVVIRIPGETLQNDGSYPCLVAGQPGVTLHNFESGTYSYTIDAYGYSDEPLYTASGTVSVNADTQVAVDLAPINLAYLSWTFPATLGNPQPTCDRAGTGGEIVITNVYVYIDSLPVDTYNCMDGYGSVGAPARQLDPGQHTISLVAVDSVGYTFYSKTSTLTVYSDQSTSQTYDLEWAVGGAVLAWQFYDSGVGPQSCSTAQLTAMNITFQSTAAPYDYLYGTFGDFASWDAQACTAGSGTSLAFYDYLPPGTYSVYMRGTNQAQSREYRSNFNLGANLVTVVPGVFPPDDQALTVRLDRTL